MLEAFRIVRKKHPSVRIMLTDAVMDNVRHILAQYSDLPIDWAGSLAHPELAVRLRSADVFVMPSIEEGFVRTAAEVMACGLPVVVTPHTGVNDIVTPGQNGEVVPIRDPQAIAEAILKWGDHAMNASDKPRCSFDRNLLSAEQFERRFLDQLEGLGMIRRNAADPDEVRTAKHVGRSDKST